MTNLVLIHGAGGNAMELTPLADAMGPELTYWSFDMLGHGGRPEPEVYSVPLIAEDLIGGLDDAGVDRAFFFGYSFGGLVAYYLAAHYPERVIGACAMGTKVVFDAETVRRLLQMLDPVRAARLGIQVPEWVSAIHAKHRMLLSTVDDQGGATIVESWLRDAQRPLLALNGSADRMVTVEETKRITELAPDSRYAIFEGPAHPLAAVPIALVGRVVWDFINDVQGGLAVADQDRERYFARPRPA